MASVQKIRCLIDRITDYGGGVYTVDLVPAERLPRFRAGQFLHLALDAYDPSGFWPESRVFSIASSPLQRDRLQIAYAVKGQFTSRMEQELKAGMHVWVKLPYGQFIIDDNRDIVLVAGGTGISAFTAFIAALAPQTSHEVHLFYGARNADLLIYKDLVRRSAQTAAYFQPRFYVENASDLESLPAAGILRGRLSIAAIWAALASPTRYHYYLSGPPPMLSSFTKDLNAKGIEPAAIHIDAWE